MNKFIALVFLMLAAPASAQSDSEQLSSFQEKWSGEQWAVWRVIEEWNDAFETNDAEAYFPHIHRDVTVITPPNPYRIEGISPDRREYEFAVERGYARVSFFQELQPIVVVNGDMAFATYYNRGWYGPEGEGRMAYLKETNVLVKEGGAWKIIHIHVSATN